MKYVKDVLTALIAVVAVVGASANVYIPVKDPGFDIEVRKLHILQNSIGNDTIDFVLNTPNVGCPVYIGRCGGRVVSSVYDADCCMRLFFVGNEPLLYEGSLDFKEDSAANRAVFSRANKLVEIDFDKADAIDRLVRLVVPQKGWKREGYTYVCGGDPQYGFVMRSTFVAELPNALADRRRMLDAITSHMLDNDKIFETEREYGIPDTLYYVSPKPEINNMYDYAYAEALLTRFNDSMYFQPLPADSAAKLFYHQIARFVEYIPVLFTDTLMTIYKYDDNVYPAGGGGTTQTSYTTYVTRGDKTVRLTADDIFRPEKFNEVKKEFVEWLAKDLADPSEPGANEYEDFDANYIYYSFVSDEGAFDHEAYEHGYKRAIDYVPEKMRKNDFSNIPMPDVALLPDGVMFMYEMCSLTGYGEDGLSTLFVPYSALKGCFRPGVLPK